MSEFIFHNASYDDVVNEALAQRTLARELQQNLETVSSDLESANNKLRYVQKAFDNRDRQYAVAKQIITNLIENNEINNEEYVAELIEVLGIEILKEVSFALTIEITGTVEIPLGTELDEYSFNVDSLSYNGSDVCVNNESISIDDWEFTE
jgi:acyl-ACP thioesterase